VRGKNRINYEGDERKKEIQTNRHAQTETQKVIPDFVAARL
jgi:hypothetical protein